MTSTEQVYPISNNNHSLNQLHDAVRLGKYDIVKKLVLDGVDINSRGRCGSTPLHLAVKYEHLNIMKYLLKNGASPESKYSSPHYAEWTPLHFACGLGRLKSAKLLLLHGANVNPNNVDDVHPIHVAVTKLDHRMINLLLENGANPNARFRDNFFTRNGGVVPSTLKHFNYVLLFYPVSMGSVDVAKLLLKYGANVNGKSTESNRTLLMEAGHKNNLEMVQLLLENGASVNDYDVHGGTALFYTLLDRCVLHYQFVKSYDQTKKLKLMKLLLRSGANVNISVQNRTILDIAVVSGLRDICTYLADNRIIPEIRDDIEYLNKHRRNLIEIRYDLISEWYRRHMIGMSVEDISSEINNPEWFNYDVSNQEHERRIKLIKEQIHEILNDLKCEIIDGTNISLFNILTINKRGLVKLAFNKKLRRFCLRDYKNKYFMYYSMLKTRLNYAIQKSLLIEKAIKSIYNVLCSQIPQDCCEEIVAYLNDEDLNMWYFRIICLLLISSCISSADKKHNKYVTTLIDGKWKDTPIVLEVSEYLNDENSNLFWSFVDLICKQEDGFITQDRIFELNDFFPVGTDKEIYNRVVKLAETLVTPTGLPVLKLSLSLRIYSARVEMFSQMAVNKENIPDCNNFIDVGGNTFTCSADQVEELINNSEDNLHTYSVDHQYPGSRGSSKTNKNVILYGQMGSSGFKSLHDKLKSLAESDKITYILRHYVKDRPDNKLRLSGYGVELQMKSTEYKATDDSDIKESSGKESEEINEGVEEIDGINFGVLKKLYPEKKSQLDELLTHLLDTSDEVSALKVWQFQELSHQAAERIMKSPPSEAVKVFTDIAQNFPMQAKSLIRTKVSNEMKKEMKRNQEIFFGNLHIQPTETVLFINGLYFDIDVIDILALLEALRSELRVMEALLKIGFSNKKMDKLVALDLSSNLDNQDFAIDIRDSAIMWINDLETDKRYQKWSSALTLLIKPMYPGTLRQIRRNFYNLVLIINPLSDKIKHLLNTIDTLNKHSAPIRVGFVFVTNFNTSATGFTDPSVAVNNAFHYLTEEKNQFEAFKFLLTLQNYISGNSIDVTDVKKALKIRDPSADIDDIFGEDSQYDVGRHLAMDFVKRTGFKTFPQVLLNGVPLASSEDADTFEETVLTTIMTQTPMLQKAVYKGEVVESDDIVDFMMSQPNVMSRLNDRILQPENSKWLNLIGNLPKNQEISNWNQQDTATWLMKNSNYLVMPRRVDKQHLYTYWVAADFETVKGRQLLREALKYLDGNTDVRITIIVNNIDKSNDPLVNINMIVLAAMEMLPQKKAVKYINNILQEDNVALIKIGKFDFGEDSINEKLSEQEFKIKVHKYYAKTALKLMPGDRAVVCNGRILGPLDEDEEFTRDDFSLLERFSHNTYGDKLMKSLQVIQSTDDDDDDTEISDDVIMQITSLLVLRPQTQSRYDIPYSGDEHSVIKVPAAKSNEAAFNLIAIVDPVSRGAQKLGAILSTLQQSLNCNIKIFLNCVDKNSDMPLKSFYRFVFDPELQFNADGQLVGAQAKFTKLPTSSLLTQYMHTPENWLVEVVKSLYDLDNIKLDNVAMGVHSEFELEHLLLEGHCFEASMGNPPRGLQITLGTEKQPVMVDTIVMANLGYFQLKANPGEWLLRLRQGRSADIYDIHSVTGQDVIQDSNEVKVLISSLKSHVLKLKVSKKPDKMHTDLLADDDSQSGIWNSISRTFGSDDTEEKDEKINIFSLASGHLYERFLKIMMLSVIKHTKSPVKFWFLKNYLSPTLKDFLPHMAKEYGFEYELVQYKWPRWLHQQTEKQRTIWGYKILFLDVLFPLDVKKIIFVDADQVVRADLKELVNLDLEGAPYAYTPFCDSRKEMEGFRFWKQGYWRNHLQGRSYHISALYVVDLKRFRRIAAGDRLRGQYQALSSDPNSLSNLDQDLPNNMIHQVAIKTLPQEWLWCETWCNDASKKTAKTIDLCNNPMTKEAKLQAAMRILPEWIGYDEEIKNLQQKVENESKQLEKEERDEHDLEDSLKHEEL
ncbi:Similar to Uggt: UDP-glucose:glycoprotein glucosyltransferase (Drosophila melanogaster) [Cotesia congregata]|uniref:Similar to Uggt: UDP-glucose:glycoprotein glucosyltransferase (Drosophila melanogaster) n=1 Tax=Cotesia congregata TaxID=51543 RepID=A0A8J2HH18_COTCN|nr:Similar to Uggt: UDP-glucose:glycoprotein glucosyltransferase (Drosophila melanogaster) [Cotesia congregata]